jgi:CRP-like cAMP-binding protein
VSYASGELLVHKGDLGDEFFLIEKGLCEIEKEDGSMLLLSAGKKDNKIFIKRILRGCHSLHFY